MPTPRVTIDGLPEQTTIETDNYVIVQDTGTTKKMLVSKILDATPTQLTAHINQATDAHDASAVSAVPTGAGVDADTVQGQLGQLASLITAADSAADAVQVALDAHITDADDAHDATAISAVSSGTGVDGATVQAQLGQLKGLIDQVNTVLGTLAATYVDVGGDTMTGPLTLPATDPPTDDAAARKAYVDSRVATKLDQAQADGLYVNVGGDTMAGPLTLPADPSAALQASTKQYVDNQDVAYQLQYIDDFVFKAGDTMTGPLTLPANPTTALQAATKQYVDAAAAAAATRPHLYLPAGSGNYVLTPDPAQLAGATQLDIRWIEKAPSNGVAGYASGAVITQATSGGQLAFRLSGSVGSDNLNMYLGNTSTGVAGPYISRNGMRPISGVAAGRFTWRSSDNIARLYTKPTSTVAGMLDNTGWVQSGADAAMNIGGPLYNDVANLVINGYTAGTAAGGINVLAASFATTVDGTPFALWRADPMARQYLDDYGVRWIVNGTAWEWRDANGLQIGGPDPTDPIVGSGFPEGVITAPVGQTYVDTLASSGAVQWIKATGTGNTGWKVVYGDTGQRTTTSWDTAGNVTGTPLPPGWKPKTGAAGIIRLRRMNGTVWCYISQLAVAVAGTNDLIPVCPTGFGPSTLISNCNLPVDLRTSSSGQHAGPLSLMLLSTGLMRAGAQSLAVDDFIYASLMSWSCDAAWPPTLPGTLAAEEPELMPA